MKLWHLLHFNMKLSLAATFQPTQSETPHLRVFTVSTEPILTHSSEKHAGLLRWRLSAPLSFIPRQTRPVKRQISASVKPNATVCENVGVWECFRRLLCVCWEGCQSSWEQRRGGPGAAAARIRQHLRLMPPRPAWARRVLVSADIRPAAVRTRQAAEFKPLIKH